MQRHTTSTHSHIRNIGIAAHVDAGKTTLSERVLFYAGRLRAMGDVRGKGRPAAALDFMDLERQRGITIQSAATHLRWRDSHINLIDTPGHVDFTVEVERALQVLDGAVLVLCAVSGVQPQTRTVLRQMQRHQVPRVAFINKMDRPGADPFAVVEQLRARAGLAPVLLNVPIGAEGELAGVVDLLTRRALYFDGEHGERVRDEAVPDNMSEMVARRRAALVEAIAELDDEVLERYLEDPEVPRELLVQGLRRATLARRAVPVLCGSAYHNLGVQPLLDAVIQYLPHPGERRVHAHALVRDGAREVELRPDPEAPLCALAFKLDEGRFGQITHVRVYQGTLTRGRSIINARTGQRVRVGRLVRLHANAMEDVDQITCGDLGAIFGITCAGGDCFGDARERYQLGALHVPEPVIQQAIAPEDKHMLDAFARALARFTREDPSLRISRDPETGETLIAGMGELHLEVYRERMRAEYGVETAVSAPQVAYRETPAAAVGFDHLHKKQDGGPGQYARVVGELRPGAAWSPDRPAIEFLDRIRQGAIPREYIPACEAGVGEAAARGPSIGAPVVGVVVELTDGATHQQDSSALAFRLAARAAVKAALQEVRTRILEPVMSVELRVPETHSNRVQASLSRRRGTIAGFDREDDVVVIEAHVPLAEMFGYAGVLRGLTQGQAEFTMTPARYQVVPAHVQTQLTREHTGREEQRRRGKRR